MKGEFPWREVGGFVMCVVSAMSFGCGERETERAREKGGACVCVCVCMCVCERQVNR